jgi:hypothetical protein
MKSKKPKRSVDKNKYQPTAKEEAAVGRYFGKIKAEPPTPRVKVEKDVENPQIFLDHPDQGTAFVLLAEALGTTDDDFVLGLLKQLIGVDLRNGKVDEGQLNFLLAVIKGIKPRDHLEAMLAAQMAVIHMTSMDFARQLHVVETLQQQEGVERGLNKLVRTYISQIVAFKHYRSGSEQNVTVQHVSVNEGGQAIVGNVTQNANAAPSKTPATIPPALTDDRKAATPIIKESVPTPVKLERMKNGGQSST